MVKTTESVELEHILKTYSQETGITTYLIKQEEIYKKNTEPNEIRKHTRKCLTKLAEEIHPKDERLVQVECTDIYPKKIAKELSHEEDTSGKWGTRGAAAIGLLTYAATQAALNPEFQPEEFIPSAFAGLFARGIVGAIGGGAVAAISRIITSPHKLYNLSTKIKYTGKEES